MHSLILVLLIFNCYLSFTTGLRELTFTKQQCHQCCDTLRESVQRRCNYRCMLKYSKNTMYPSVKKCVQGCKGIVEECRHGCNQACLTMFATRRTTPKKVTSQVYGVWVPIINNTI